MIKKCGKKCRDYKFTIGVVILILIAILMPGGSVPQVGVPGLDKVIHFGMFFTLTAVFYVEYLRNTNKLPVWYYAFASIFTFAGLTEFMQLFAEDRSMDVLDLSADTLGIFVGSLLIVLYVKLSRKKTDKRNA